MSQNPPETTTPSDGDSALVVSDYDFDIKLDNKPEPVRLRCSTCKNAENHTWAIVYSVGYPIEPSPGHDEPVLNHDQTKRLTLCNNCGTTSLRK